MLNLSITTIPFNSKFPTLLTRTIVSMDARCKGT